MKNWIDVVPYFRSSAFEELINTVADLRETESILPSEADVFKAYRLTPLSSVKAVILGQDPYPNKEHAMGLAFSVPSGVSPLPKSLQNIFTELFADTGISRQNGDLTDWAQQGVLLLNTYLTVLEGKPGSHQDFGWTKLTDQTIKAVSTHCENVVFVLWGNHAAAKTQLIDSEKHHTIISPHPSPLAAYRGFFGSRPFSNINYYLASKNIPAINW